MEKGAVPIKSQKRSYVFINSYDLTIGVCVNKSRCKHTRRKRNLSKSPEAKQHFFIATGNKYAGNHSIY